MASLDFTARCRIDSNDEFGRLSQSLNTMSANLQDALQKLEHANTQLEKEVRRERLLQVQRKELTDNLSHQMKTPLGLIRAYTEGLKDEVDETEKAAVYGRHIICRGSDKSHAGITLGPVCTRGGDLQNFQTKPLIFLKWQRPLQAVCFLTLPTQITVLLINSQMIPF